MKTSRSASISSEIFICDLQGDTAFAETYRISFSEDRNGQNATVYDRYIDRVEKRQGEWKIADRLVVLDLMRIDKAIPL